MASKGHSAPFMAGLGLALLLTCTFLQLMSTPPSVLLVDSNESDRSLSKLLVQRELPEAVVTAVPDALALAESLLAGAPDVAVIAADLEWFKVSELLTAIKRWHPATSVVLFGRDSDVTTQALGPGLVLDGVVQKSSSGFMRLVTIIGEVLARTGRRPGISPQPRPAAPGAPARSDDDLREATLMFSHDLKQPVQQIVRLARQGQAAESFEGSRRALQHVQECAERAGGMLDGMVEYLAVTRRAYAPVSVDLNRCLHQALNNLRSAIDEAHAEIRVAPLPTSMGDERQLTHLFQNLISNAIKFRGIERPIVTISVDARGDSWVVAFKDNGIGIPEGSIERVFELGTRLHTREEYPGTGIGLALCRRIVERHGGRLWAESREGDGSTFYVLLPGPASSSPRLG
jgi:signal transduction histidine kinase